MRVKRSLITAVIAGVGLMALPSVGNAAPITWTDWTSAVVAQFGSAAGTAGAVGVTFSGNVFNTTQTGAGTNYWAANSAIYTHVPEIDNPPPGNDIITLVGGTQTGIQTITFSQPVTNPVMAILSLGQPGFLVTYNFGNENFVVRNFGAGHFGGPGTLTELAGEVLQGNEGHGVIQFLGTFTTIDWTIPVGEIWHGFQVGIPGVQQVPEPATLMLLAGGAAVAIRARRTNRKRAQ